VSNALAGKLPVEWLEVFYIDHNNNNPPMIPCQRSLFDIPEDITYLNCAYMSPLMRSVAEAGKAGVERKLRPWKITPDDFFSQEEVFRGLAARLFHCAAQDVAIVPSASYGISTAARSLPLAPGQKILVLDEQFPSNFYSWDRLAQEKRATLVKVPWPDDGDWTPGVLRELKDGIAIAALPHTQWTSGGLLDLVRIGQACRLNGTALVLDLTQSLGALPFDASQVQPDFAVAATYKWLLGPYSMGVMYVAPKWQQGKPLEENWIQRENARQFSALILYTEKYDSGARRFDMGERSNFGLMPAAIRALEQLLAWGVQEISDTIGALNRRLLAGAQALGLTAFPDHVRAPHYLCLRCSTPLPARLVENLAKERVYVSVRGSSIRVAPHVYNSEQDAERLISVLRKELRAA
jgi:selenocysteine lyase/cysteine desulfurase